MQKQFKLNEILACPECRGAIEESGGTVRCCSCAKSYKVKGEIYAMLPGNPLSADEYYQQSFYDKLYSSQGGRQVYDLGYVENSFFKLLSSRYFLKKICEAIKPGDTLLDLGCGGGNIARNLIRKPDVNLVNLDISEKALRHAAGFAGDKSFYV